MNDNNFGLLIHEKDIKIHRAYFKEMCKLLGVKVVYRSPKNENSKYTTYGEIDTEYNPPCVVECIFDEYPTQKTLKKLGWVSELSENSSLIHLPYDLENLQQGCLFIVPSGIDKAKGRLFRVVNISNIMIYPASICCEIVPEFENTYEKSQSEFEKSSFNLLNKEQGYE